MLRILSGYFSDSYFCSSLDSLKIQADEDGVRTIAIVYLICLFFFSPGNLRCPECLEKTLLPDEQFQFFFCRRVLFYRSCTLEHPMFFYAGNCRRPSFLEGSLRFAMVVSGNQPVLQSTLSKKTIEI